MVRFRSLDPTTNATEQVEVIAYRYPAIVERIDRRPYGKEVLFTGELGIFDTAIDGDARLSQSLCFLPQSRPAFQVRVRKSEVCVRGEARRNQLVEPRIVVQGPP